MEAKCDAGQVRTLGPWSGSGMAECINDIRQNDIGCEVPREETLQEAANGLKTHLNLDCHDSMCKKDILGNSIAVENMPSSDIGNSTVNADVKIDAELEKGQSTVDKVEETNISVETPNSLSSELHSSKADDDVDKTKANCLETSSSHTFKSVLPEHVEECVSAEASNSPSTLECSDLPQSSSHCSPSQNTLQPSSPVTINQSGIQSDIDGENSSALKPVSSSGSQISEFQPKELDVNHSSDISGESEVKENQSEILCEANISSPKHGASKNDNGLKDDGHEVEASQETSSVEIAPVDSKTEEDAKMQVESQDITEAEKSVEKMPQNEECETNSALEKIVSDQHDDGCSDEFSTKEGSLDNHDISPCNERSVPADTNDDVNMADAEAEMGNANSQDSISGEGNDGESQTNLEEEADNAEMEFCDIKIAESISMAVDDSGEMTEDIVMCDDETDRSNDIDTDDRETATTSNENDGCASSAQIQIEKTEGNTMSVVMTDSEGHSNDITCEESNAPAESEKDKNNVTDPVSLCDEIKSHTPSPQSVSARENDAFCPEITNVESHEDKTFDCTSLDTDKIIKNHEVEETGQFEKCSQGENDDKCSASDLSLQLDKSISEVAEKVLTENDKLHAADSVQSQVADKPSSPVIKDEADVKTNIDHTSDSSIIQKDKEEDVKSEETEEKASDHQEDMKTGVSEGDVKVDVDMNLEETDDKKKIKMNSQVDNESLDDKIVIDMKEDNDDDLDDEILFIDDDGKSKPLSEAPKLSFKNILKAPSIPPKVQNDTADAKCIAEENKKKISPESPHSSVGMKTITTLTHTKLIPDTRASVDSKNDVHEHKPGSSTSKPQEEVKLEKERKRSLSDKDDAPTTEAKRTKLDAMIDKLGNHLGKKPSEAAMEVLDSDDEAVLLDEKPNETVNKVQSTQEECEDKTADGKSEDDSSQVESKDEKPLQLTSQVLQSLIVAHIKAFAKKQRQSNIEKLNRRTRSMQSATNLWKDTAKHLERTVLELTVLNQKLEKRKAHSNAVKQLASRTIGVQVGNDLRSSKSGSASANGPTNKKPEPPVHSSTSLSLPPSVLLNPPPSQPQQPQQNARFMQQPTNRPAAPSPHIHGQQIRGGRPPMRMQANNNVSPTQAVRQPGFANGRIVPQTNARVPTPSAPAKTVVNLIDLTDEEDTVKRTAPQAPRPAVTQPASQHISKLGSAWKMSSSPSSGPTSQAQVPASSPGVVMGSNSQLIQPPAPGGQTQIITQGNPPVGVPISQCQFVNIANAAAQRPGTYFALVPGPGARTPTANIAINPSQANMGAGSQNSTPQSSTAAAKTTSYSLPPSFHISSKHPAPLPSGSDIGNAPPNAKKRPPKPGLKISRVSQGIVLSWNMPFLGDSEKISSYQLFAYQETESSIPKSNLWKKVGDVKALPLPMACTLTQFQEGNKYHFAVRAVDHYGRSGPYSDPSSIFLGPKT